MTAAVAGASSMSGAAGGGSRSTVGMSKSVRPNTGSRWVRQALATKPLSGAIGWFKSVGCQTRAGRTSGLRASAWAEAAPSLDIVCAAA